MEDGQIERHWTAFVEEQRQHDKALQEWKRNEHKRSRLTDEYVLIVTFRDPKEPQRVYGPFKASEHHQRLQKCLPPGELASTKIIALREIT